MEPTPCTCWLRLPRPIFDPLCNGNIAHRWAAVTNRNSPYDDIAKEKLK